MHVLGSQRDVRTPEAPQHGGVLLTVAEKGWRLWSRRERRTFEELCGDPMDSLYPGWRRSMQWTVAEEMRAVVARQRRAVRVRLATATRAPRCRLGVVP